MAGACLERRNRFPFAVKLKVDRGGHLATLYKICKESAIWIFPQLGIIRQWGHDRAFRFDDLENSRAFLRVVPSSKHVLEAAS